MPVLVSDYQPPWYLRNGHIHTLYKSLSFRKLKPPYARERLILSDGDFILLDWLTHKKRSQKLVIISHGLEGSSLSSYAKLTALYMHSQGYDVLAWNFRGCGGEINEKLKFYHSCSVNDLQEVILHAVSLSYKKIFLTGFSLGGNLTLFYMGTMGKKIPPQIKAAATFSVPVDLRASSIYLERPVAKIYMQRFMRDFKKKLTEKKKSYPNEIDIKNFHKIKSFRIFDRKYTAPMNGFESETHYWRVCSSLQHLHSIKHPVLLMNSKDDPFLPPSCFPYEIAEQNPKFYLEISDRGGHCGYVYLKKDQPDYMQLRAAKFFADLS